MTIEQDSMLTMPVIGTAKDVASILKLNRRSIYNMSSRRDFRKGIYLGRGRYNLSRLKHCIEVDGSYLREVRP